MTLESGPIGNDHTTEIDDEDIFDDVEEDDSPAEIDQNVQKFIDGFAEEAKTDSQRIKEYLDYHGLSVDPGNLFCVDEFEYTNPEDIYSRFFKAMLVPLKKSTGEVVAFQYTFLSDLDPGVAKIREPRSITDELYKGALHGAYIQLGEITETMAVTSHLESGLAILKSGTSAIVTPEEYIPSIELLPEVKAIECWANNSSNGYEEEQLDFLAATQMGNGLKAFFVSLPEEYKNWYSLFSDKGESALKKAQTDRINYTLDLKDESTETDDEQNYRLPLLRKKEPGIPYPVNALGPRLKKVAKAIAEVTQAPDALCAHCVLAVATLVAQPYANVEADGRVRPISNFFFTIGESGERKSAVDEICLRPIREHEAFLRIGLKEKMFHYQSAMSVYEKKHKDILKKDGDFDAMERALAMLGPPPEKPLGASILFDEATIEGLLKFASEEQVTIGQFSDEMGRTLGGHGMTSDNQLKTISGYSQFWDNKPVGSLRSSTGKTSVSGKRFSMHLMGQETVAEKFLSNPLFKSQGIASRILLCQPDSNIGNRVYSKPSPESYDIINDYTDYMKELLRQDLPLKEGGNNELDPRSLPLSDKAKKAYVGFYNTVETSQKEGNKYENIRGFASKTAEHALRLAAVQTIINDPDAENVPLSCMLNAIHLMEYYLSEAKRQIDADCGDDNLTYAQDLLKWMEARGTFHPIVDVYQKGPMRIRNAKKAKEIMGILADHGWVEFVGEMTIKGQVRKEVWKLI